MICNEMGSRKQLQLCTGNVFSNEPGVTGADHIFGARNDQSRDLQLRQLGGGNMWLVYHESQQLCIFPGLGALLGKEGSQVVAQDNGKLYKNLDSLGFQISAV